MRQWCTLGEISTLSRQRILDANDLLDAQDEAEDDARRESEKKQR